MSLTPRPTVYHGQQMRSRLEARVAAMLFDWSDFDWEYEPRAYRSDEGEYLPDFQLDPLTFLEVKPAIHDLDVLRQQIASIHRGARIIEAAVPGGHLWALFSDGYIMGPGMGWSVGSWCKWRHLSLTDEVLLTCLRCDADVVANTVRALEYRA